MKYIYFIKYSRDFIHYENIYGNHTSKLLCLGFHILASIVTSPILYIIIRYEKNSNYRTLINQLVSSIMWNALAYNLIMPALTLLFNIISPSNSPVVCRMYFLVNNVICFHMILLLDSIIVIKYIFIFHLKNPTAVQDDFWTLWINLWTFIFFLLSEIAFSIIPGRDIPRISICIGKVPLKHLNIPYKFGVHIVIALLLTILITVGFATLSVLYRVFGIKKLQAFQLYQSQFFRTNKDTLFSFITTFIAFVLLLCAHGFSAAVASLHPSVLDSYPFYIMEYTLENLFPSCSIAIFIITHLYYNDQLRRAVWIEIKLLINCS